MKKFYKGLAATMAVTMILSVTSCAKNGAEETTVASDESVTPVVSESATTSNPYNIAEENINTLYGDQLPVYLDHQYYFNGEPVSIVESNYYFIQGFSDLCDYATYMDLPTTSAGLIDLGARFNNNEEGQPYLDTWGEFLVEYAETQIESTCLMVMWAEESGITLTADMLAEIDDFFVDLEVNSATPNGLTLEEYLKIYFGESCTQEGLREVMCHLKLAELYMADYVDNYEFTEDQLMVPNVRYALFYAPAGTAEDIMSAQEAAAQALFDESETIELLQVNGAIGYTEGTVYEYGDELTVDRDRMDTAFVDWAYDESRQEGDVGLVQSDRFGFFVMGYLGKVELSYEGKTKIAMNTLNDTVQGIIDNGEYEFRTDDEQTGVPMSTEPTVEYSNVTVIREGEETAASAGESGTAQATEGKTDIGNVIIIALLLVIAGGIGGAGVYGTIMNKKNNGKKDKKKDSFKK